MIGPMTQEKIAGWLAEERELQRKLKSAGRSIAKRRRFCRRLLQRYKMEIPQFLSPHA